MHYLTFLWKIYKQAIQIRKYICENVPTVEKEYTMKIETEKARKLKSKILDYETFRSLLPPINPNYPSTISKSNKATLSL